MSRLPLSFTRFALAAVLLAIASCAGTTRKPPGGWFGNTYLGGEDQAFDARKVFVINFQIDAAGAKPADMLIVYGVPSRLPTAQEAMRVELLDAGGRVIATLATSDPRVAIVEQHGTDTLTSGMLSVRLAYDPAAKRARLRDAAGKSAAEADLAAATAEFCRRNRRDSICATNDKGQTSSQ